MTPRWRYVGQLGPQDGQLGSSLGGVLANFSGLERNRSKNSGSVKTSVTMVFWLQIKESCWLQDGTFCFILGDGGRFGVSGVMLWHHGAKIANKSAKIQQMSAKHLPHPPCAPLGPLGLPPATLPPRVASGGTRKGASLFSTTRHGTSNASANVSEAKRMRTKPLSHADLVGGFHFRK